MKTTHFNIQISSSVFFFLSILVLQIHIYKLKNTMAIKNSFAYIFEKVILKLCKKVI